MVKGSGFPGLGRMAARAALAEGPVVPVVLLVAGKTIRSCAFEHVVDMAALASHVGMAAGQLED